MSTETAHAVSAAARSALRDKIELGLDDDPLQSTSSEILDSLLPIIELHTRQALAAELRARTADLIETGVALRGEAGFVDTDEVKAYRSIALALRRRADELEPPCLIPP